MQKPDNQQNESWISEIRHYVEKQKPKLVIAVDELAAALAKAERELAAANAIVDVIDNINRDD